MNLLISCRHLIVGLALVSILSACATKVSLPTIGVIKNHSELSSLAYKEPQAVQNMQFAESEIVDKVPLIAVNKKIIYGFIVSPELFQAQSLVNTGDIDKGLKLLGDAQEQAKTPFEQLYISLYRIHALNLYGRMPEAESLLVEFEKQEFHFNQSNLMTMTLRGDLLSKFGETSKAITSYKNVLQQLAGWRFPTSYSGPPSNIDKLSWLAEVRSRVTLGLALAEFFQGNYAQSKIWAQQSEQHTADIMSVLSDFLYGPFLGAAHPDIFLAHAVSLTLYGSAQVFLKKSEVAGEIAYQAARHSFKKIGFVAGEAYISIMRTKALLDSGNIDAALVSSEQALPLVKAAKLHDFTWRLQYLKGLSLLESNKLEAENAFREAQIAVDELTGILGRDAEKRRFGIGKEDISYQLTRLSFQRRDAQALFSDLERGRARAFVDMMADVVFGGEQANVVQQIRKLDQLSRIQFQRHQMMRSGMANSVVNEDEKGIAQQRQQAVERISRRNPDLASLLNVSPESLAQVLATLDKDALLTYYLPTHRDEKLRRINISHSGVSFEQLAISGEQLALMLKQYHSRMGHFHDPKEALYRQKISDAMQLESWKMAASVYIVPSDVVHYVPWGALDIDKPMMVIPTASWLLTSSPIQNNTVTVVVGNPAFNGELSQLPGAADEVRYIAGLYKVKALTGSAATKQNIRKEVGAGVGILHLATHAQFNVEQPLQSRLFLSKPGGYEVLTAKELFENPLPAKLVVLSACETGVGEVTTGDDFLGLQRSFYLSGASTVISSLWQVEDKGTALFMKTFHRAVSAGNNYGQAWLDARNAVKKAGMPSWIYGAFIIGGKQN